MTQLCPISNYQIRSYENWSIKSSNKKYKIKISIIGDNIILLKNFGYTSFSISKEIHPQIVSIIANEFGNRPYYIIYDYENFTGISVRARNNYIKWVKKNKNQIKGVYFYNTNSFTKILVKTSNLLLNKNLHIHKTYEEVIKIIVNQNSLKTKSNQEEKRCPFSNFIIKAPESWVVNANNGKYRIEISIIDNNILSVKNIGFATKEITESTWPLIFNIFEAEIIGRDFFLIHDFSDYLGASSEVRINYAKWIKSHSNNLLGLYVYAPTPVTSILLKTGKLLLKDLNILSVHKTYKDTILDIKHKKDILLIKKHENPSINNWELDSIVSIKNNIKYVIKRYWILNIQEAVIHTFLINDNIFIRKYTGTLNEDCAIESESDFTNILKETQIQKYHFYTQFSDDVILSLAFRKYGVYWFNKNYKNILTGGFYNLSFINKVGINMSKTFLFHKSFKKRISIYTEINEIFNNIQNFNSNNKIEKINEIHYKGLSKNELIELLKKETNEKEAILKSQKEEIISLYNKLGRLSWDEDYNFEHKDIDSRNNPFSDLNNAILLVQEDVKELLYTRDKIANKALESDRLKSAFLANMSHEIRTPLNSILGFSELLEEKSTDPNSIIKYSKIIINSGKNLLNIINDIIDISKIESGQLSIVKNNFDIYSLINITKELFEESEKLKDGKIIFIVDNQIQPGLNIMSDEMRIQQIINNLISNAIKFTEKGYIRLTASYENNFLSISVEDTGIGIEEDKQALIFDRFRQEDLDTTHFYGGSGLGLSISKALAQMLNGDIFLTSTKGKGSIFELKIATTDPK